MTPRETDIHKALGLPPDALTSTVLHTIEDLQEHKAAMTRVAEALECNHPMPPGAEPILDAVLAIIEKRTKEARSLAMVESALYSALDQIRVQLDLLEWHQPSRHSMGPQGDVFKKIQHEIARLQQKDKLGYTDRRA